MQHQYKSMDGPLPVQNSTQANNVNKTIEDSLLLEDSILSPRK